MDKRTKNIISGVLLIALAACLVLWKLDVFNLPFSFAGVGTWGIIITIVMLVIIFHSIIDLNFAGLFIPAAIIAIIFDEPLGITAITPWIVLIAALLLTIAFDKLFPKHKRHIHVTYNSDDNKATFCDNSSTSTVDDGNGWVNHTMKFGSSTKYITSDDFRGASLESQFGELSVFFNDVHVPSKKVNIHCSVSFGEMQLYIPKEWRIENRVSVTLGDCNDRGVTSTADENSVLCVVEGSVSFGDLVINRI